MRTGQSRVWTQLPGNLYCRRMFTDEQMAASDGQMTGRRGLLMHRQHLGSSMLSIPAVTEPRVRRHRLRIRAQETA